MAAMAATTLLAPERPCLVLNTIPHPSHWVTRAIRVTKKTVTSLYLLSIYVSTAITIKAAGRE